MANLAMSYSKLGRHSDALAMEERVLEFLCRVLPENHPDIGEWLCGEGSGASGCEGIFFVSFELHNFRRGHGQPCFDVLRIWKARRCACNV